MGVKLGYKQSVVGAIPVEWGVNALGKSCDIVTKGTTPTSIGRAFATTGVGFLKAESISESGHTIAEKVAFIDETTHTLLKRSQLKRNDVLVSIAGVLGRVGLVEESDLPANTNQALAIVRLGRNSRFERSFLFYSLRSSCVSRQIRDINVQAAQANISLQDVRHFLLPTPPLSEQRAIAAALSDVDSLLGGLDRLIAKKRDLKQAAMQQLLTGQTRLPGFSGAWEVKRLGEVGKCLRGVSYKGDSDLSTHDTPHTKRLLRSNNIQNAVVVTDEVQFVNAARVSSHQILQEDDILICMANGSKTLVGKAGIFTLSDGQEYTFGAFMGCFRTNSTEANPAFAFYLFLTARYRDYINNLLAGSSINNLRPSSIESLEFSTPPLPEQTAIAAVLSDMDAELAALQARRDKTRDLKQAMMQELLTGRTRLV
jgi:type I restriction enzyme S subunit